MILHPRELIDEYTALGAWGTETLDDTFRANVAAHPERVALVDAPNRAAFAFGVSRRLSYRELDCEVERMAAALLGAGLARDDVLVVQMPNVWELVAVYLAGARTGIIISPLPMQYREHELSHVFRITRAKAFLTVAAFKGTAHALLPARCTPRFEGRVLAFGEPLPEGALSMEKLLAAADLSLVARHRGAHPVDANDVFTICWTSGTEAVPKGVPRSHNNWRVNGWSLYDGVLAKAGDHSLVPFPITNMAGLSSLVGGWLFTAGRMVLHHPFDMALMLRQMESESITYTICAPAVFAMLLKDRELLEAHDLSSLRAVGSGSTALDPWTLREFQERHGIAIANFFGSNEGMNLSGGAREIPDAEKRATFFPRFGSGGYEWPARVSRWIRTRLADPETGAPVVQTGRPGEMLFKGPSLFPGYYNAPELNARAFDEDGYFRTGDLFEIAEEDGDPRYYRYVGRCKDIIIRGGMNISPEELDLLLVGHPKIREAAMVGVPDAVMGERVCAVVVPKAGETVTLEDVVSHLKDKGIAVYKLPERMEIAEALPRSPFNKVLRRELRARYVN